MSSQEQVTVPEDGVDVLVQPLPYDAGSVGAQSASGECGDAMSVGVEARVMQSEMPFPYLPVSAGMAAPREGMLGPHEDGVATLDSSAPVYPGEPDSGPMTRPPPQVMTALGPMPLPPEVRRRIPEKFVAKPIIEEREIYIAKKEVRERTIEVPHVHYEHKFAEVAKNLKIKKLVPQVTEVVKEVPREVYKPVIEEKVIEVPQGVKFVEVPVEVPCLYPPKIVPKPKVQIVERVVETIKPVVKEKIVEVLQTVVKQIPKVKMVEVPYYVPRYVEKIIEVPYQPSDAGTLPPLLQGALPQSISAQMPAPYKLGPIPMSTMQNLNLPYEAQIDVKICQNMNGQNMHGQNIMNSQVPQAQSAVLQNSDGASPAIQLPDGFQWGAPPYMAPGIVPKGMGLGAGLPPPPTGMTPSADPRLVNMPPLMVTCPPEVGTVNFAGYLAEPDILTRQGVMPYQGFRQQGNFSMLFPPLQSQPGVPMNPPGTPDVRTMQNALGAPPACFQEVAQDIEQSYEVHPGGMCGFACTSAEIQRGDTVYEQ